MTGFGDAACVMDGVAWAVELRSLNNRYFKASIRLPDELSALEPELESLPQQLLTPADSSAAADDVEPQQPPAFTRGMVSADSRTGRTRLP